MCTLVQDEILIAIGASTDHGPVLTWIYSFEGKARVILRKFGTILVTFLTVQCKKIKLWRDKKPEKNSLGC